MFKKNKKILLKEKKALSIFAVIGFILGVIFLDLKPTGNIILSKYLPYTSISVIGVSMIFCSIILIAYYFYKYK